MTVETIRRSGAKLMSGRILKRCLGAEDQARIMLEAPEAFCNVNAVGAGFYVMPEFTPFSRSTPRQVVYNAISKLRTLWSLPNVGPLEKVSMQEYYDYVLEVIPDDLSKGDIIGCKNIIGSLYGYVKDTPLTKVSRIHGDATLQNIVWDKVDYEAYWIDPNPRLVPLCAELDIGKLLQSAYGYDEFSLLQLSALEDLKDEFSPESWRLSKYFCATHIIRLLRYQNEEETIKWAMQTLEDIREGFDD